MRCRRECRWAGVVVLAVLPVLAAAVFLLPKARLQFLSEPEPEKPNLHILGIAPLKASPERDSEILRDARRIIAAYPEVAFIYSTARLLEDDGTKTTAAEGYHLFVELRPQGDWPAPIVENG